MLQDTALAGRPPTADVQQEELDTFIQECHAFKVRCLLGLSRDCKDLLLCIEVIRCLESRVGAKDGEAGDLSQGG